MSFTSFRNDYLSEAEARLSLVNVAAATTNELLINGALYKMAGAVAQIDLLNAEALRLLESMSGAQLETYLTDVSNRAAFEGILASSTAMTAVAASSTAMTAVIASSTAMTAVAASSTAMTAVAASSTAMNAVFNSLTAKAAVWASDTAVGAIAASTAAYNWLITNKAVTSAATNVALTPGTSFDTGKSLLLDVVMNTDEVPYSVQFTTKQGTVGSATGPGSVGHRYTTTRFKNIMAVTNLKCLESEYAADYTVTLRYVVMD